MRHHRRPYAALFVWGVWTVMSLLTLGFVLRFAFTLPFADEWLWVPVLTGEKPFTVAWLWESDNHHRLFLP